MHGAMPRADGLRCPKRRREVIFRAGNRFQRRVPFRQERRNRRREGAACAVRVRRVDVLCRQPAHLHSPSYTKSSAQSARCPPLTTTIRAPSAWMACAARSIAGLSRTSNPASTLASPKFGVIMIRQRQQLARERVYRILAQQADRRSWRPSQGQQPVFRCPSVARATPPPE
jgi:hypothetical protein